ncbi:MAG: hypothetical protein MUC78_13405 [Bacteroidales bacterium]|jgi:hypothetical protein|nr:hypothetical protein [Bacteroidales bacterium]
MKKVLFIISILTFVTLTGAKGQGMGQTDNEKLTAYKIAFFTQRLNLTAAEAEKFWPVYNDYSAKKNKTQLDRISLMRYASQNEANMSDTELTSTADKLAQSFIEEANLTVSFTKEIQKVLPPVKVIRLFQIENQYKQQLLRELNQRRQGQPQGTKGKPGQIDSQEF